MKITLVLKKILSCLRLSSRIKCLITESDVKKILVFMLIALCALSSLIAQVPENLEYSSIQEAGEIAKVRIESNVKKTQVYLNGVFYGKAPLEVDTLMPGDYVLTVFRPGYNRLSYIIEVRKGYKLTYKVYLEMIEDEAEGKSEEKSE